MRKIFDVCGLGNAIVDIISHVEEKFLVEHHLIKGEMRLIDEVEASSIFSSMRQTVALSGGSVANSLVGIAALGGKTSFIGKVKDDQFGNLFCHDIRSMKVNYEVKPTKEGPETARSYILVTPDGERTMCTYLGAAINLLFEDINIKELIRSKILYVEGYLWDQLTIRPSLLEAIQIAKENDVKVALTLSDTYCVERHKAAFLDLIRDKVDILFANEGEIKALYSTRDLDYAIACISEICSLAAITRSELGCVIVSDNEHICEPAWPVDTVIDTTGAGDLFASGFLFGITHDLPIKSCAKLGSILAAHIIQQTGARSQSDLMSLYHQACNL